MYLVIVRRQGEQWVVDEDSHHVFDEQDRYADTLELKIAEIRVLGASSKKELLTTE
jgi:hypothetical protein